MPTVINGIGTWYYGKRRIHTLKATCEFCGCNADLVSYDTTLFVVVFFVPLIPIGQKRILQQCSVCQKHRVVKLSQWEEGKERDAADLMERLSRDPNDRDTISRAIGFALAYQDEPLFSKMVELAGRHTDDSQIQAQLGDAHAYFAHWPEAEQAYRDSLAAAERDGRQEYGIRSQESGVRGQGSGGGDQEPGVRRQQQIVREQLAWALLKQGRPDEARPYLQHVIDEQVRDSVGMVYFLIKGYQAQGRHDEALALMDERDEAFPDLVTLKEYQQQRKTSTRYQGTQKPIRDAFLDDKGKAGYREGGWTARMPRVIAAAVFLGALGLYLGSAIWIGQARQVYLVNGTGQAYTVVIGDQQHTLKPNAATAIRTAEGDVQVSFADAKLGLEPIQGRIESSFWTRPFAGHTFVINPDEAAVVIEEETFYAKANPPPGAPPTVHFGQAFYSMPGVDFEFQEFPQTMTVSGNSQVRKTRVGLVVAMAFETRFNLLHGLDPQQQVKLCQHVLRLDPGNILYLHALSTSLAPEALLKFVETRLDDVPILVEWHRVYQSQMERLHPETDLLPRYRKLVADTNGHADALYLLGRAEPDADVGEKLYRQAASAKPPSANAISGLGFRALSEARFAEARQRFEEALPLLTEKYIAQTYLHDALLGAGDYDRLIQLLQADAQTPGRRQMAMMQMIRVDAIRGDKAGAQQKTAELLQMAPPEHRQTLQQVLQMLQCLYEEDVEGYLKSISGPPTIEASLLRGNLKQAADLAALADQRTADTVSLRGLVYLEATRTGAKDVADAQWMTLLADLKKRGRDERFLGEILAGAKPLDAGRVKRLPIEPSSKRVLLTVLAQRYPDQAKELLPLARRLNFQRDAISLCLRKFLKEA